MGQTDDHVLRPDVRIVAHDDDVVEVRTGVWSAASVTLTDDEHRGILADILLALSRGEATGRIVDHGRIRGDDVASVVEVLLDNEMMVPRSVADGRSFMPYLGTRTIGLGSARREPPRQVVIAGRGHDVELFVRMLGEADRERVTIMDGALLDEARRRDLYLERHGMAIVDARAPFAEWQGTAVVALGPELDPILLRNLNRLALDVGFQLLPAAADGPFGIIGPTVIPRVTACFECAETRVLDAMRDHTLYTRYREALAEGRVHGGGVRDEVMNPFHALVVAFAAWEVSSLINLGTAYTAGKLLTIYAPTMEIAFHDLLLVPGCAACSPPSSLDAPLYSDLRAYLRAQLDDGSRTEGR
jgi:bacteriocin biosynthesis cyclodehydratase domain-containing protein